MKILFVAAEATPFAKVGGLGDVVGALPGALRRLGHDARVFLPRYRQISTGPFSLRAALDGAPFPVNGSPLLSRLSETTSDGVPIYLIECGELFDRPNIYGYDDDAYRYLYFSKAAIAASDRLGWVPDVIHCHDWHTSMIPRWTRYHHDLPPGFGDAASVVTIHNLAHQGAFDPRVYDYSWIGSADLYLQHGGWFSVLGQGLWDANLITTVSERYAQEITTPAFGEGLDDMLTGRLSSLRGILNGIDYEAYNPETDPAIAARYSSGTLDDRERCKLALQQEAGFDLGPRRPIIGFVGRLFAQKGFDLIVEALERLLAELDLQVVILGSGEPGYEDYLRRLSSRNRRQVAAYLGFDPALAQRIYAGVDMFLMPSQYEPCGLAQMIALRYGAVPIVRSTGGLADTVLDYQGATGRGTGFVFKQYDAMSLIVAIARALEVYREPDRWRGIQVQGMERDFSWQVSARRYVDAYQDAIQAKAHA